MWNWSSIILKNRCRRDLINFDLLRYFEQSDLWIQTLCKLRSVPNTWLHTQKKKNCINTD